MFHLTVQTWTTVALMPAYISLVPLDNWFSPSVMLAHLRKLVVLIEAEYN